MILRSFCIKSYPLLHVFKVSNAIFNRKISCHSISFQNAQSIQGVIDTSHSSTEVPSYIDFHICSAWEDNNDKMENIKSGMIKGMTILPNFITEEEENALCSELEPYLKKMRYEFDHWDDAIHGFRETERSVWKVQMGAEALLRARNLSILPPAQPLPHTHVLDLDSKGYIKPHVDSIRFCGTTVAGICLLSPAVMRLRHSEQEALFADYLLSRRCLYIMKDAARYDFSHEVLRQETSFFKGQEVPRTRRISLICRSQPDSIPQR